MGVALPVVDLAPDCQLDKFRYKVSNAKGKVATFIFFLVSGN